MTGRLIAYWRERHGLSRAELAKLIDVSRPAVVQWETGKTAPTDANVRATATALGLTMAEFYAAEQQIANNTAAAS